MLLHIPDILTRDEVAHFRHELDRATWTDGRETVGPQGAQVKRNLQLPDASPLRETLGRAVLEAVARHPTYHAATLPQRTLMPRFNRYEGGGQYGDHIDNAIFGVPGSPQRVRSDISATLFFSEPGEYEGGELIVQDSYGSHSVKLPAGHMVVYPGSSLHRVAPVTRGVRLAAFFWIQSLVREDHRRAMLLELDNAIQSVARSQPGHESLPRLTGVYHNLIREWSDT